MSGPPARLEERPNVTETVSTTRVGVTRLAGNIGAELTGVDTGRQPTDDQVAQIRQALLQHKVVFLRDQHLDYTSQVAFAGRLGPLTLGHPTLTSPAGQPYLREIDSRRGGIANSWHTDVTFVDQPPALSLLHSIVIPEVGGDTLWANTVTAYRSLPKDLRDLADKLRIVHANSSADYPVVRRRATGDPSQQAALSQFVSETYATEHPAVRVHPETSEHSLLAGAFARHIVGFPPSASRDMIRTLQEYITRPEQTVRWHWQPHDLVIWDNRATQHYAIHDYGTALRRGERVTVAGEAPVGVDGRPSTPLQGDASAYYATAPR
jgi:taurine dioxygenase